MRCGGVTGSATLLELERMANGREPSASRKGISSRSLSHQETNMRALAAAAFLLLVAACDRSNHAQRTAYVPAAQPAPSASAMAPASSTPGTAVAAAPASGAKSAATGARKPTSPGTARSAEAMYPDYANTGKTAPGAGRVLSEHLRQQEQRDQELLDRDADEALARERDAARPPYESGPEEDVPPSDEGDMDQPPPDEDYGPQDDSSPTDDNYPPDDYAPPDDDYPPPDDDYPPPYDR
jgi:hypothetical protein